MSTDRIDQTQKTWKERTRPKEDMNLRLDVAAVFRQLKGRLGTACTEESFRRDLKTLIGALTQIEKDF